jgi:hypothetical protein
MKLDLQLPLCAGIRSRQVIPLTFRNREARFVSSACAPILTAPEEADEQKRLCAHKKYLEARRVSDP